MQRKNSCPWCQHTQSIVWEHRIWQGEDVETVAVDTPFSTEAAHAHVREHMGLALSAPLVTEVSSRSAQVPIPPTPATSAPTPTGSALSVTAYAAEFLGLASKVVASADNATESGSLSAAMTEIETRAKALDAVAASLGLDAYEAEALLNEATATVRGVLRAQATGLVNDLEFLATLIREEGGHRIAHAIEHGVRERQRA